MSPHAAIKTPWRAQRLASRCCEVLPAYQRQRGHRSWEPSAVELTGDPADVLAAWSASTLVVPAGHPNAGEPMTLPDYGVEFLRAAASGSSRPRASARHWPARPPTSRADTAPTSRDRPPRRRAPARRWANWPGSPQGRPNRGGYIGGPEHGAAARLRRPTRHAVAAGTTAPAGQAGPLPAVAGRWGGVPFSAGALPARARPPVTSAETSRHAKVAAASRGYVHQCRTPLSHGAALGAPIGSWTAARRSVSLHSKRSTRRSPWP